MSTIKKETKISSTALMTGVMSDVTLFPSEQKGIRFFINDAQIEAKVENVVSTEHCTVLGNAQMKVMLIEHFMAACAFCGIDSLDVCLSHFELPILDGSSKNWVELFEGVGVTERQKQSYTIKDPVFYVNGKTHLVIIPNDEFAMDYAVNFQHKDLNNKWTSYNETQKQEIIEARTFGYLKELEAIQQAGFAKGVSLENTVGLTEDGYTTTLKSTLEPIKHKMLDVVGDFYLTGINPFDMKIKIIAKEAGHAVHVKVAKLLKDRLELI